MEGVSITPPLLPAALSAVTVIRPLSESRESPEGSSEAEKKSASPSGSLASRARLIVSPSVSIRKGRPTSEGGWLLRDVTIYPANGTSVRQLETLTWETSLAFDSLAASLTHPSELPFHILGSFLDGTSYGLWPAFLYRTWYHERLAAAITPYLIVVLLFLLAQRFQRGLVGLAPGVTGVDPNVVLESAGRGEQDPRGDADIVLEGAVENIDSQTVFRHFDPQHVAALRMRNAGAFREATGHQITSLLHLFANRGERGPFQHYANSRAPVQMFIYANFVCFTYVSGITATARQLIHNSRA